MERIVTNTLVNVPAGAAVPPAIAAVAPEVEAAQEGGSLTDTLTAPMLELCMGGTFPPQPTAIITSTAKIKTGRKRGLRRPLKRNRALEIIGASQRKMNLIVGSPVWDRIRTRGVTIGDGFEGQY